MGKRTKDFSKVNSRFGVSCKSPDLLCRTSLGTTNELLCKLQRHTKDGRSVVTNKQTSGVIGGTYEPRYTGRTLTQDPSLHRNKFKV